MSRTQNGWRCTAPITEENKTEGANHARISKQDDKNWWNSIGWLDWNLHFQNCWVHKPAATVESSPARPSQKKKNSVFLSQQISISQISAKTTGPHEAVPEFRRCFHVGDGCNEHNRVDRSDVSSLGWWEVWCLHVKVTSQQDEGSEFRPSASISTASSV